MSTELHELPRLSSPFTGAVTAAGATRYLPLGCPECREPIRLTGELCGNRLVAAILLQAERIGTELECDRCGLRFIFNRTFSLKSEGRSVGQRLKLSSAGKE